MFEVKCTENLPRAIEEAGGRPVMWKAGHSLIKKKIKEESAPLGGEFSGHTFFAMIISVTTMPFTRPFASWIYGPGRKRPCRVYCATFRSFTLPPR